MEKWHEIFGDTDSLMERTEAAYLNDKIAPA